MCLPCGAPEHAAGTQWWWPPVPRPLPPPAVRARRAGRPPSLLPAAAFAQGTPPGLPSDPAHPAATATCVSFRCRPGPAHHALSAQRMLRTHPAAAAGVILQEGREGCCTLTRECHPISAHILGTWHSDAAWPQQQPPVAAGYRGRGEWTNQVMQCAVQHPAPLPGAAREAA